MPQTTARRKPISFANFGENFIDLILNGDVLERALVANLPAKLPWKGGIGGVDAEALVKITIGDVKHVGGKAGDHKIFDCPIEIGLHAEGAVWGIEAGSMLGHISVKLQLTGYCIHPLGIKVDIAKISKDDIDVVIQAKGILTLIQPVLGLTVDVFKEKAIDWVDDAFRAAKNRELFFDLEDQIKTAITAATGGGAPAAGGGGAPQEPNVMGGVPLTFGGPEITARIAPGQSLNGKLPPKCDEVYRLILLTRLAAPLEDGITLVLKVLDQDDALRAEQEITCTMHDGWMRTAPTFYSETSGADQIRFLLMYPPAAGGAAGAKPVLVDTKMKIELV